MDEEVAKGRVVFGIVGKITAVFEPAPGEQDGVVARIVGAGVAKITSKQGKRVVEQGAGPLRAWFSWQ